jgi:hypothetical protein
MHNWRCQNYRGRRTKRWPCSAYSPHRGRHSPGRRRLGCSNLAAVAGPSPLTSVTARDFLGHVRPLLFRTGAVTGRARSRGGELRQRRSLARPARLTRNGAAVGSAAAVSVSRGGWARMVRGGWARAPGHVYTTVSIHKHDSDARAAHPRPMCLAQLRVVSFQVDPHLGCVLIGP